MTNLTLNSKMFTHGEKTSRLLAEEMGFQIVTDDQIIKKTAQSYKIKIATLNKVVLNKQFVFNDFTHEREKSLACLKKTVAEYVNEGNCLFQGILGLIIPTWVSHVIRILIVTDRKTRIAEGMKQLNISKKVATNMVNHSDKSAIIQANTLFNKNPLDESLYDIIIPSDKIPAGEAVNLIKRHLKKLSDVSKETVIKEARDFKLAADVDTALARMGEGLVVTVDEGQVMVTIEKKVLMLNKFTQNICKIVRSVPGVQSVNTRIGKNYHKADIIRNFEFETPLNVLLVDDEKEFVQTISERLQLRQIQSEMVYSGKDALDYTNREDTDVIVLDLKMPGIDGLQVLQQIKKTKPDIEVIILTAHGSEQKKKICMEMGAFAFLDKPADIDILADTMRKAYKKITNNKMQVPFKNIA